MCVPVSGLSIQVDGSVVSFSSLLVQGCLVHTVLVEYSWDFSVSPEIWSQFAFRSVDHVVDKVVENDEDPRGSESCDDRDNGFSHSVSFSRGILNCILSTLFCSSRMLARCFVGACGTLPWFRMVV